MSGAHLHALRMAFRRRGSGFSTAMERLDAWADNERIHEAMTLAEELADGLPDLERVAPQATWARVRDGGDKPPWWSLVRAVRFLAEDAEHDRFAEGALAGLTALDFSAHPYLWADLALGATGHADTVEVADGSSQSAIEVLEVPAAWTLRELRFDNSMDLRDVSRLGGIDSLKVLSLNGHTMALDLGTLRGPAGLRELSISDGAAVQDLSFLQYFPSLRRLVISGCRYLSEVSGLAHCSALRALAMRGVTATSLEPLGKLPTLERVQLGAHDLELDLAPLASLGSLTHVTVYDAVSVDLQQLASLPGLQRVRTVHVGSVQGADAFGPSVQVDVFNS